MAARNESASRVEHSPLEQGGVGPVFGIPCQGVDRMLAGELRNGHGQWRFPNSVKAWPKLERAIVKLCIGGHQAYRGGVTDGRREHGAGRSAYAQARIVEKGDSVRLEGRPNEDGAERAAYHPTRRRRIGYCVFCRACSPVMGVILQAAPRRWLSTRGNV